jgi:hypothetical protein
VVQESGTGGGANCWEMTMIACVPPPWQHIADVDSSHSQHSTSPTSLLMLYKHMVGHKRVLIYTRPPFQVEAACILTFVAAELEDGWESHDDDDDLVDTSNPPAESSSTTKPKKRRRPIPVLGMVTLNDLDRLEVLGKHSSG